MSRINDSARREQLRKSVSKYYNIHVNEGTVARPAAGTSSNPMDVDSESFNQTDYTTHLLKHSTLPSLIERDNALRREAKQLDSELQRLVYENYREFIVATDTIRDVSASVQDMDAKLTALDDNVRRMDDVSTRITTELDRHRRMVEEEETTNAMLRKVQFLVKLPDAMDEAARKERWLPAVKAWALGDSIFGAHSDIQAFARTRSECQLVAERLYTNLSNSICEMQLSEATVSAVREKVEALRLLSTTSLDMKRLRDGGALLVPPAPGAAAASSSALASSAEPSDPFDRVVVETLLRRTLERFRAAVADANAALDLEFQNRAQDLDRAAANVGKPTAVADLMVALRKRFTREILERVRTACRTLRREAERAYELGGADLTVAATAMSSEVAPVLLEMLRAVVQRTLGWARAMTRTITVIFGAPDPRDGPLPYTAGDVGAAVSALRDIIVDALLEIAQSLTSLDTETALRPQVDRALERALSDMAAEWQALGEPATPLPPPATALEARRRVRETLVLASVVRSLTKPLLRGLKEHPACPWMADAEPPLRAAMDRAATALALAGVRRAAADVLEPARLAYGAPNAPGSTIAKAASDAAKTTDPEAASEYMCDLCTRLSQWGVVIVAALPSAASTTVRSGGSTTGSNVRGITISESGMTRHSQTSATTRHGPLVASFQRRDDTAGRDASVFGSGTRTKRAGCAFAPVTIDAAGVMETLVIHVAAAMCELSRGVTFSRLGFQQLQVDAALLIHLIAARPMWFTRDDRALALVDEFAASAFDRTRDRVPLHATAVEPVALKERDRLQLGVMAGGVVPVGNAPSSTASATGRY